MLIFCSAPGNELAKRLSPLALCQVGHIAKNYGDKPTAQLKRLLETLIERAG